MKCNYPFVTLNWVLVFLKQKIIAYTLSFVLWWFLETAVKKLQKCFSTIKAIIAAKIRFAYCEAE